MMHAGLPGLLYSLLLSRLHSSVVVMRPDLVLLPEFCCDLFALLAGETVDDARLFLVRRIDDLCDAVEDVPALLADLIRKIGPVETLRKCLASLRSEER